MTAQDLLTLGLTNALLATLLALAGWLLTRLWPNPHVASAVWLVVLLKLVTPPLVELPIPLPREGEAPAEPPRPSTLIPATGEPRASARGSTTIDVDRSLPLTSLSPLPEEGGRGEGMPRASVARTSPPPPGEGQGGGERLSAHIRTPTASPDPAAGFHLPLSTLLATLWLTGTLAAASITATRVVRFRRALRGAALPDPAIQAIAAKVAADLGLRRCPAVLSVPTNVGPLVWAANRSPVVIVPCALWDRLGEAERETLLAHELAHLARGDHWVRRFEAVVLALYWWLPTAWLAVRRREAAAESCCDALVLATYPDGSRSYAEALYVAASVLSAPRPLALASGLGGSAALKERLTMIAHARVPRRPSRPARIALALAAVAALVVSGRLVQADPPSGTPATTTTPAAENGSKPEGPPGSAPVSATSAAKADDVSDAAEEAASLDDGLPSTGPFRRGYGPSGVHSTGTMRPSGMAGAGSGRGPFSGRGMGMMPGMGGMGMSGPGAMRGRHPVQLSAEVREKMIASLVAVIEQPDQPAEVKAQALRSLGQIGQGSPAAEKALLAAAESAKDDQEKLAAAEALNAVGSPKGVEATWTLLDATEDWDIRVTTVDRLDGAGAVPATSEAVRTLTWFAAREVWEQSKERASSYPRIDLLWRERRGSDIFFGRFVGAAEMLRRLTESGDGVRLLVEAIRTTDEPSEGPVGFVETPEGSKSRIEDIYGTETPVRDLLLPLLASTVPSTDEIAVALVEALSGDDPAIREAAAQALGNAGPGPSGMEEMMGGMPGDEAGMDSRPRVGR